MLEIDCRICKNLGDDECLKYGKDCDEAVKKCAADGFRHYHKNNPAITVEDIKNTLEKLDKIQRPFIIYINPEDAKQLKECIPDINKKAVLNETLAVDRGICYALQREEFDYFRSLSWLEHLARQISE